MSKIIVEKPVKSKVENQTKVKVYIDHEGKEQVFVFSFPCSMNKIKDIKLE